MWWSHIGLFLLVRVDVFAYTVWPCFVIVARWMFVVNNILVLVYNVWTIGHNIWTLFHDVIFAYLDDLSFFFYSWVEFAILHFVKVFCIYKRVEMRKNPNFNKLGMNMNLIGDVMFNCLCSISFTLFICLSQSHARIELSKANYALYGFFRNWKCVVGCLSVGVDYLNYDLLMLFQAHNLWIHTLYCKLKWLWYCGSVYMHLFYVL